jgi:hypothetical protein
MHTRIVVVVVVGGTARAARWKCPEDRGGESSPFAESLA